jgi:hypothetical protein
MNSQVGFNLVLGVVSASLLTLFSMPSDAIAGPTITVVASGLDNPRGLAFGPEGALYITEAGRGGPPQGSGDPPENCIASIEFGGQLGCFGPTGAVTRLWEGKQERIVTGIHSIANPTNGGNASGPQDISFQGWNANVVVGGCFAGREFDLACGDLIRLKPADGTWQTIADLGTYEINNNPDSALNTDGSPQLNYNPNALLALPGRYVMKEHVVNGYVVADAGGNDLLRVAPKGKGSHKGKISTLAVFPARLVADPTSGAQIPMQAVPTSVALGPDGALYVGELTGYPFPVGGARIYRVVPGEEPQVYAEGFTNIIDLVFEDDGSLLVLEHRKKSILSGDLNGALIRLKPDGSRETLVDEGLTSPTAMAIGYDGIYVSNCGVCGAPPNQPDQAGLGQVIRIVLDEGQ